MASPSSSDPIEATEETSSVPQTAELSPRNIPQSKEGWLEKKGAVNKNWRERWFTLKDGVLEYFVDKEVRFDEAEKCLLKVWPWGSYTDTHIFGFIAPVR